MKRVYAFGLWSFTGLLCLLYSTAGVASPKEPDVKWVYERPIDGQAMLLNAESIFYWGHKIRSSEELPHHVQPDTVNIGNPLLFWNQLPLKHQQVHSHGKGTFHLQILLPDTLHTYALRIKGVLASYELWEQGSLLASVGTVGFDQEHTIHDFKVQIIELPRKRQLDLFLVIANYYHWRGGGIAAPIYIGEYREVVSDHLHHMIEDAVLIFILIAIGLYHLALFIFYPKNKAYIYFALFILAVLSRELCIRNMIAKELWPSMPHELMQQLRYVGFYLGTGFAAMCVKHICHLHYRPIWHRIIFVFSLACSLLTFLLPLSWVPYISPVYQISAPITVLYLAYVLGINLRHNFVEKVLMLSGALLTFIALIHDILIAQRFIQGEFLFLYGFAALVLAQTLLLAYQNKSIYLKAHQLTRELSYLNQHLEEQVASRTLEIRQQQDTILTQKEMLAMQAQELQKNNEELKELDRSKSQFFINTSHEFRTPLTLILSGIQKIQETAEGEVSATARIMEKNARLLRQQVDQLLDITKLEAKKMLISPQPVEGVSAFRMHAQMLESLFAQKKIAFFFHSELPPTRAMLDPDILSKVCLNLLSNAYKFTSSGGKVAVYLSMKDNQWIFQVQDSGVGIPAEKLPYIFERFYQADQGHQSVGTGIGLALVQELVNLHNGSISVESIENKGSVFTVQLPYVPAEEEMPVMESALLRNSIAVDAQSLASSTVGNSGEKPLVLVVEDHQDLGLMLRQLLSTSYEVIQAFDGEEGIAMAIEKVPDLIISDVMMPKKDGFELCHLLKQHQVTSHIPIVLLTARVEQSSKLEGLKLGADDYLPKPFENQELLLRIRNLIKSRKLLKRYYSNASGLLEAPADQASYSPIEKEFVDKLHQIVDRHYTSEQLGVDTVADEMAMSASQLRRKMKALMDITPNKFIQQFRLKKAVELLRSTNRNVGDIGLSVGFSSRAYFNQYFKDEFGQTPKNYQKALLNQGSARDLV